MRTIVFAGAWACALLLGCEGFDLNPEGQLTLAITTDMEVPDELDAVSIEVLPSGVEGGAPLYEKDFSLAGSGETSRLPLAVGFSSASGAAQAVHLTVRGSRQGRVRVIREAETTLPVNRQALLRMPLGWLCADKVVETDDGEVTSDCPPGTTCNQGQCVDWTVDSSTLGYYAESRVFGTSEETPDTSTCFDVVSCFEGASAYTPVILTQCVLALPSGSQESFNLAVIPGDQEGFCGERCYVPIDQSGTNGWTTLDPLPAVQLPQGVCQALQDGSIQGIVATLDCPTKTEALPTCGEALSAALPASLPEATSTDTPVAVASVESLLAQACTECLAGQCAWEINSCLADSTQQCLAQVGALSACVQGRQSAAACLEADPPDPTPEAYIACVSDAGCGTACMGFSAPSTSATPSEPASGGAGGAEPVVLGGAAGNGAGGQGTSGSAGSDTAGFGGSSVHGVGGAGAVGVGGAGAVGVGGAGPMGTGATADPGTGGAEPTSAGGAVDPGTGGTGGGDTVPGNPSVPTDGLYYVQSGGYVSSGSWHGYAWTTPCIENGSTIEPSGYGGVESGSQLCLSGQIEPDANWGSCGMLGISVAQNPGDSEGVWEPDGDGVRVQVTNPGGSQIRLQLAAPDTTTGAYPSWCVQLDVFDQPVFVPWASFNTACWDGSGEAYQREPIKQVQVMVPGDDSEIEPFEFCIEDLGPETQDGAAGFLTVEEPSLLDSCPNTDCAARSGDPAELLIDSVEVSTDDSTGTQIELLGGRQGKWYVYCDDFGTWQSGVDDNNDDGHEPIPSESDLDGARLAMVITGEGFTDWGASLGLNPSFQNNVCNYDASMYGGVGFLAKNTVPIRFSVETQATLPCDGYTHGLCPSDGLCFDHFGIEIRPNSDWTYYEVTWNTLAQAGWGIPAGAFDPTTIAGLQWQIEATAGAFTIGVDEVSFLPQ